MGNVTFRMQGSGSVAAASEPRSAARVRALLDGSDTGDLWSTPDMMRALGLAPSTLSSSGMLPYLEGYHHLGRFDSGTCGNRRKRLWGSKATIKALQKELKRNGEIQ